MRPGVLLAPLLLSACASWPPSSYALLSDPADVGVLAPAISDCVAEIVPDRAAVTVAAGNPVLTSVLAAQMRGNLPLRQGQPVRYVVAPFETGEFIRVSAPGGICSQYFSRVSGTLKSSGPQMVVTR